MHGDVPGQFSIAARQRHDCANSGPVSVISELIRGIDTCETTHRDILANLVDQLRPGCFDYFAVGARLCQQRLDVFSIAGERRRRDRIHESDEVLVLGNEVGFRVDFGDDCLVPVGSHDDAAVGRDAAGFPVSLCLARFSEKFDGCVYVAAGLDQGFLAIHHSGAAALAEFFNH